MAEVIVIHVSYIVPDIVVRVLVFVLILSLVPIHECDRRPLHSVRHRNKNEHHEASVAVVWS